MREIVFDTETTGFGAEEHRILEIGCVELVNRLPSGRVFHTYLNPERAIDYGSTKIHGITDEKVRDAPKFAAIADKFLAFVEDAPLVAHNAEFDFGFMNSELARCGRGPLANPMVDTLAIAKQKLPGQRHNLDALCRFYNVDNSARNYHGALLDAQLLADVYVELLGGLQADFLGLADNSVRVERVAQVVGAVAEVVASAGKVVVASEAERARHAEFVAAFVRGGRWG
ncbi:MAG: DNA polymerase III subunit epsilon [Proteobacteria bacterium]|nr:DNA polymerase III subunit epsilon [Pseudomonadota bacterium]